MTFKSAIGPELPYLRRYARAITGTQRLGDAAVQQMLEGLLEAPEVFDMTLPPRAELYRLFHRLWKGSVLALASGGAPTSQLAMADRQVLMLTSVEGFSLVEVAKILGRDVVDVTESLERAREIISRQLKSDILIIEDEMVIALHVQAVVADMGHTVVGIAQSAVEAIAMTAADRPELILADINLGEGPSGIDAVKDILERVNIPVIFVTAYPERLLTGERPEPTYLITKPFEPSVLVATIAQALMFHREHGDAVATA
jgi:CheY-like chemotaxis protein